MTCPKCGATISAGALAERCDVCSFSGTTLTTADVVDALKKGAAERRAAEQTLKRKRR